LHVHAGRLTPYAGNYDYYLEKSKAGNARAALTAGFTDARPVQAASGGRKSQMADSNLGAPGAPAARKANPAELKKLRIEVGKLEQRVSELETKQNELTAELEKPETYQHPGTAQHLNRELSATVDLLQTATTEWEKAATRLAELEKN
jgi:ATP-binding cassette subfamily F protein 3